MWKNTRVCKYGACGFLLRKNGCGDYFWLPQLFVFSAHQLNIADTIGSGDSVRNRNNRPLLCLAFAISQRACPIVWVYHALIGECNHACSCLRTGGLRFFIFVRTTKS